MGFPAPTLPEWSTFGTQVNGWDGETPARWNHGASGLGFLKCGSEMIFSLRICWTKCPGGGLSGRRSKTLWLWVLSAVVLWQELGCWGLQMGGKGISLCYPRPGVQPCWRMEKPGSEEGMRPRSQMPEGKVLWNSSPQRYCYTLGHPELFSPQILQLSSGSENGRGRREQARLPVELCLYVTAKEQVSKGNCLCP